MNELRCGGDWLVAYADDELTGDERQHAAEHVAGCARCHQELTALRSSLLQVQGHWHAPLPVTVPRRPRLMGSASVMARAAIVAAVVLTLGWQLASQRDSSVALAPTTNPAPNDLESDAAIDDWLQRETQIARLRTASALLAQEPGMQERGEQLEQYLSRTYGN
jgi:anti-sigma factor RsiW